MPAADSSFGPPCAHSNPGKFLNTHWSVVLSAADRRNSSEARESLEKLCRAYWRPLYSFVRSQGESPLDAQDLIQAFFARLVEKDYLQSVHPDRGRFRSFLLAALKHFLSNERDKARAKKRGGGQVFISIDVHDAETHHRFEPIEHLTPQKIFERQWATSLLERTMLRLREEYTSQRKVALFEELKATLTDGPDSTPYGALAARLDLSVAAVKMAVHRLRQRYRQALRAEVANTVASPGEVEDELREVFRVFSE